MYAPNPAAAPRWGFTVEQTRTASDPAPNPKLVEETRPNKTFEIATSDAFNFMLHCICLLLAQSGHPDTFNQCPLSGAKRTLPKRPLMSASDPKRTSAGALNDLCLNSHHPL